MMITEHAAGSCRESSIPQDTNYPHRDSDAIVARCISVSQ